MVEFRYFFHDLDITLDLYEKIQACVELIAEKENISFEDAYEKLSSSNAFRVLKIPDSLMWYENKEYIVSQYYKEIYQS